MCHILVIWSLIPNSIVNLHEGQAASRRPNWFGNGIWASQKPHSYQCSKHCTGAEKEINPETGIAMKEFVEKYRPLRQRTVWEETTMDKARASPPAIYMKQLLAGLANGFNSGDQPVRAQQRQRKRSSYFGKWECDRCHICWRLYRWSGSYWGANRCRRIWHGLRKRLFWPKENEDITPITVSRSGWAIFAQFRLDF